MGPKIESALRFLHGGGHEVIITSYEYLGEAVAGRAGTHIVMDVPQKRGPQGGQDADTAMEAAAVRRSC
jgi:hypothetical protein